MGVSGVAGGSSGNRLAITKKLMLWSVLLLQLAFIVCIWLLQTGYNINETNLNTADSGAGLGYDGHAPQAVNFVKQVPVNKIRIKQALRRTTIENVNRYNRDFYQEKINRLNRTAAEYEMGLDVVVDENVEQLWCFREGTLNESRSADNDAVTWELQQLQCRCAHGWHGKDCGQPEIIWRALMVDARSSSNDGSAALQLRLANPGSLHRLYYMFELSYLGVEMLELQIRNVIEVVDCFLIYYISNNKYESASTKSLRHSLDEILVNSNYILYCCELWRTNCSTQIAYNHLRRQLVKVAGIPLKSTDLLLYSNAPAVLVPQALKFLKYYATDVMPLRFRLKYNVYGFYWQHPVLTKLSAVISSLVHLHNPQYGRSDPQRLERQAQVSAAFTLGDLNHFGGWYCQYCQQPEEIVALLQASATANSSSQTHVKFPNATRSHHIDSNYLQRLIADGLYIDGKTQLQRLRRYSDKYYAPQYAEAQSSKFAHLLVNLYESLDDVEDDSDGIF